VNAHPTPRESNSGTPTVSIVVPVFGARTDVERCLRALDVARSALGEASELVLVVNRDPGLDVEQLEPDVLVLRPARNLGFAGGVQAGIAAARGAWIALINDDAVVEPEALRELLLAGLAEEGIGGVAPTVCFADEPEVLNSLGLEVDALGVARECLVGAPRAAADARELFGASGAAALLRRRMLEEVGGFDTSFFAYYEDADLAWRARMLGWRAVSAPRAVVIHGHSTALGHTAPQKRFLVGRNRVRMLAKNATRKHLLAWWPAILAYDAAYVIYVLLRDRSVAPLRGRIVGLMEWRRYRRAGEAQRRPIALAPPEGLCAALSRDAAYRRRATARTRARKSG
jgi:GT2 family glycosyltransferase